MVAAARHCSYPTLSRGASPAGPLLEGHLEMKAIVASRLGAARVRAPHCEGVHCCDLGGEVRVYPLLFAAQVILCRRCWELENHYHQERGRELRCPKRWPQHDWDTAESYRPLSLYDGSASKYSLKLAVSS
jgi:hypothetical protein